MRIRVKDKTYKVDTLQNLTLAQIIAFDEEMTREGLSKRWSDIEPLFQDIVTLAKQQKGEADPEVGRAVTRHPDFMWFVAILTWSSRTQAGEKISVLDAIDVPMREIEMISDPDDHRPKQAPDPRAARSARKAGRAARDSGRGGKRRRG